MLHLFDDLSLLTFPKALYKFEQLQYVKINTCGVGLVSHLKAAPDMGGNLTLYSHETLYTNLMGRVCPRNIKVM